MALDASSNKNKSRHPSTKFWLSLFAWGDNSSGQLGIGAVNSNRDIVEEPVRLPDDSRAAVGRGGGSCVRLLCGGERHSLLLREDGCVLACGGNEYGQLGTGSAAPGGSDRSGRFSQVTPLESKRIVCVAAGAWHSLGVDEDGQVFSWGRNHRGQLGREDQETSGSSGSSSSGGNVRLIRQLSGHQASQVSAGQAHSLVLTQQHLMFTFGDNSRGQLGQGHCAEASGCRMVGSLVGLPISRVACGGNHCLALSHAGVVFGWGANNKGQLGCGDRVDQAWPMQCKTLRGQQIRHVACGFEHSVALTADGGLFTFGAGYSGQLGHGGKTGNDEVLPRRVADLMGSAVTQVACGRAHTLAYLPASGRVYGFGSTGQGQLGRVPPPSAPPQAEVADKKSQGSKGSSGSDLTDAGCKRSPHQIQCFLDQAAPAKQHRPQAIFASGNCSFLKTAPPPSSSSSSSAQPEDFRSHQPSWLAAASAPLRLDSCLPDSPGWSATPSGMRRLGSAAMNLASYNCSFLSLPLGAAPTRQEHGLDLDTAVARLERLGLEISKEAEDQLLAGLISLLGDLRNRSNYPDVECLRFFLVIPFVHLFARPSLYEHLHSDYAQCLLKLEQAPAKIVSHWLVQLPSRHFSRLVRVFKSAAGHILELPAHSSRAEAMAKERSLECCMQMLRRLHELNPARGEALACSYFYMPELNARVDIARDYAIWLQNRGKTEHFSFCDYPFVFDGVAKTTLLRTDARIKMGQAIQAAQTRNFLTALTMDPAGMVNPHLVLEVRRSNVVGDAISHLSKYPPEEFRKPLRVKFVGEDAVDEGGVSKEFFQLIFREILNPLYGMFRSYDSRLIWFNAGSLEDASLFHLIGILCGLAIYNDYLAGVAFPLALYKKLLDRRPNLDDLKELDPVVGRNLQALLEMESPGDVEALALTFEIAIDYYGELRRIPLAGAAARRPEDPVTLENRQQYVDAYLDFVFTASCRDSYAAFNDGFHKVCGGYVLRMFEPSELQTMLVGEADNFHWEELERGAEYLGVYFAKHEVIRNFWHVFHRDLNDSQRRKFLHFLTGCDRVPIQGMSAVKIRFQPVSGGAKYLPVAHTCYNLLDLPMYPDKETLRLKLTQAIEQTEGFALA